MTHRVAVTGYAHEANALAEPIGLDRGIDVSTAEGGLAATWDAGALVRRLRAAGDVDLDVEVVELPCWELGAGGPLSGADFRRLVQGVVDGLHRAGPVDAIVVLGHGAGRTTDDLDPDATFLEAVRAAVGDGTPIVTVLDFHANLTGRMCDAVDVVVGYRTNPHIDIQDRLVEAADHVVRLLRGARSAVVHARVPLLLPQIAQNTTPGEPLAEVAALARTLEVPPIRSIAVFGGFSLSDLPDAGVHVCVTADAGDEDTARHAAVALARAVWDRRGSFRLHTTPLDRAVAAAVSAARGETEPLLLADVNDNPGGGAPGDSPFVLTALHDAGVQDVVMGLHCDTAAVNTAWAAGVGARCRLVLNAGSTRPLAPEVAVDVRVLALTEDSPFVPDRGVYAGSPRHPGRCAAIELDGIRLALSSRPVQCADETTLRHAGLDPTTARVVVVKSRGHFRAGFDHRFPPERILEVGAPGVATNDLASVAWSHLTRPVHPFDTVDGWEPDPVVHRRRSACERTAEVQR
jgi:microcystin degradation protein MlrC